MKEIATRWERNGWVRGRKMYKSEIEQRGNMKCSVVTVFITKRVALIE